MADFIQQYYHLIEHCSYLKEWKEGESYYYYYYYFLILVQVVPVAITVKERMTQTPLLMSYSLTSPPLTGMQIS